MSVKLIHNFTPAKTTSLIPQHQPPITATTKTSVSLFTTAVPHKTRCALDIFVILTRFQDDVFYTTQVVSVCVVCIPFFKAEVLPTAIKLADPNKHAFNLLCICCCTYRLFCPSCIAAVLAVCFCVL